MCILLRRHYWCKEMHVVPYILRCSMPFRPTVGLLDDNEVRHPCFAEFDHYDEYYPNKACFECTGGMAEIAKEGPAIRVWTTPYPRPMTEAMTAEVDRKLSDLNEFYVLALLKFLWVFLDVNFYKFSPPIQPHGIYSELPLRYVHEREPDDVADSAAHAIWELTCPLEERHGATAMLYYDENDEGQPDGEAWLDRYEAYEEDGNVECGCLSTNKPMLYNFAKHLRAVISTDCLNKIVTSDSTGQRTNADYVEIKKAQDLSLRVFDNFQHNLRKLRARQPADQVPRTLHFHHPLTPTTLNGRNRIAFQRFAAAEAELRARSQAATTADELLYTRRREARVALFNIFYAFLIMDHGISVYRIPDIANMLYEMLVVDRGPWPVSNVQPQTPHQALLDPRQPQRAWFTNPDRDPNFYVGKIRYLADWGGPSVMRWAVQFLRTHLNVYQWTAQTRKTWRVWVEREEGYRLREVTDGLVAFADTLPTKDEWAAMKAEDCPICGDTFQVHIDRQGVGLGGPVQAKLCHFKGADHWVGRSCLLSRVLGRSGADLTPEKRTCPICRREICDIMIGENPYPWNLLTSDGITELRPIRHEIIGTNEVVRVREIWARGVEDTRPIDQEFVTPIDPVYSDQ
ncbi:hypothetical protein B0H63DRAFT_533554 [Podospora didyma]|uniref:Uncharacterized protein n=1 Tax=Podospora didyma TaxID=330526 RepID=A0AAE0P803_9PEZI|nr:hypothetical protein B0H63DRAFT_533554 [Podospora didyma]